MSTISTQGGEKWGTHVMGPPAAPNVHADNQKAALQQPEPYVQYEVNDEKPSSNPFEPVINLFNSWSNKAEIIATKIWQNLKTGPSVSEAALGKVNLKAKALPEGGFELLFKEIFGSDANEKLKKTYACYLSTSAGPVAGTLYISTARLAFSSNRPLYYTNPSGQGAWSYYKVIIPLGKVALVNPVTKKENPPEKYIQITTIDALEFWLLGFVNHETASQQLQKAISDFRAGNQTVGVQSVSV